MAAARLMAALCVVACAAGVPAVPAAAQQFGLRWVLGSEGGGFRDTHMSACARHGLKPTAATVPLSWDAAALATVTTALGLAAPPPGEDGRADCCVNGLWCSNATCVTHGFGRTFHNFGWLPDASSSLVPVFTCTDAAAVDAASVLRVTTARANRAQPSQGGQTLVTVTGYNFGADRKAVKVRVGDLECTDVEMCHRVCRPCPCAPNEMCLTINAQRSFCAPLCDKSAGYRNSQNHGCPCDAQCYVLHATSSTGQLMPIQVCTNPNPRLLLSDICTDAYAASVGIDRTDRASSRLECRLQPTATRQCEGPGATSQGVVDAPVFVSRGVLTSDPAAAKITYDPAQLAGAAARCAADADCDDGDICTVDTCDTASGCCRSVASPLCHTQLAEAREPTRLYYDIRRSVLSASSARDAPSMRRQLMPANASWVESIVSFVDDKPLDEMPFAEFAGGFDFFAETLSRVFISANGALQTRKDGARCSDGSTNFCPLSMSNGVIAPYNADLAPNAANDAKVSFSRNSERAVVLWERIPFYMSSTMSDVFASQMRGVKLSFAVTLLRASNGITFTYFNSTVPDSLSHFGAGLLPTAGVAANAGFAGVRLPRAYAEEAPGSVDMCRVSSLACMEPTCGAPGDEISIRWQPANCYGVNASDASRVQLLCRFGGTDAVARRVVSGSAAHLRCTVPSLAAGSAVGVMLVMRDMRAADPNATELALKLHTRLEHNDAVRPHPGLAPTPVVHHQLVFRHEPDPVRSALCSCSLHRQATSDTAGYLCSSCGICHNMYPGVGTIHSLGEATKAEKTPAAASLNTTMVTAVAAARAFRLDCTGECFGVAWRDECGKCVGGAAGGAATANEDKDCFGTCHGSASVDACGACTGGESGRAPGYLRDCNGDCRGSATLDRCGVCSGGNTGVAPEANADCAGVCNGTAHSDICGVCVGGTTGRLPNATQDCHGTCNGTAAIDDCGDCSGGLTGMFRNHRQDCAGVCIDSHIEAGQHKDCAGVCHGAAARDECGTCVGGSTGVLAGSAKDCAGVCHGDAAVDNCGACAGGTTGVVPNKTVDCAGVCRGAAQIDSCGRCFGGTTGLAAGADTDCFGTCFGAAFVDQCGTCVGGDTGRQPGHARDCHNTCNGNAALDECGTCSGGNTNVPRNYAKDCNGDCHGRAKLDSCNQCYGGNAPIKIPDTTKDCAGVCGGSADFNSCGVCTAVNPVCTRTGPKCGASFALEHDLKLWDHPRYAFRAWGRSALTSALNRVLYLDDSNTCVDVNNVVWHPYATQRRSRRGLGGGGSGSEARRRANAEPSGGYLAVRTTVFLSSSAEYSRVVTIMRSGSYVARLTSAASTATGPMRVTQRSAPKRHYAPPSGSTLSVSSVQAPTPSPTKAPESGTIELGVVLMVAVLSCFGVISVSASGWCMRNICVRCRSRLRQRRMRLRDIWSVERGIPPQFLAQLPSITFDPDQKDTQGCVDELCAICIEEFKRGDVVRKLQCSHAYHAACLDEWLAVSTVCPLCKTDVRHQLCPLDDQDRRVARVAHTTSPTAAGGTGAARDDDDDDAGVGSPRTLEQQLAEIDAMPSGPPVPALFRAVPVNHRPVPMATPAVAGDGSPRREALDSGAAGTGDDESKVGEETTARTGAGAGAGAGAGVDDEARTTSQSTPRRRSESRVVRVSPRDDRTNGRPSSASTSASGGGSSASNAAGEAIVSIVPHSGTRRSQRPPRHLRRRPSSGSSSGRRSSRAEAGGGGLLPVVAARDGEDGDEGRGGSTGLRSQAVANANASGTLFECENNCGFRGFYDVVAEHERTCQGPAVPLVCPVVASAGALDPAVAAASSTAGAGDAAAAAAVGRHNTHLVSMPPHASGTIRI